jgi:hypothetical protein
MICNKNYDFHHLINFIKITQNNREKSKIFIINFYIIINF